MFQTGDFQMVCGTPSFAVMATGEASGGNEVVLVDLHGFDACYCSRWLDALPRALCHVGGTEASCFVQTTTASTSV